MKFSYYLFLITIISILFSGCYFFGHGDNSSGELQWTYLGLENEGISAIEFDPTNPDIIYVGSSYDYSAGTPGRLFKSEDGGLTWDTLLVDYGAKFLSIVVDPTDPNTIYAAPWGIIKSEDGGKTWKRKDAGIFISSFETHVGVMLMDPVDSNILYAGTGGPMGGRLYKSTDAGEHWFAVGNDSLRDSITSIAIDPQNSHIIYAGTDWGGILWKSTDSGEHWSRTGLGMTSGQIKSIYWNSGILYVGLHSNPYPSELFPYYGMYSSQGGGDTWMNLNQGLPLGCGVNKIVSKKNSETIYTMVSVPNTNPLPTNDTLGGIFVRNGYAGSWNKIGITTQFDFYDAALQISTDGKYLYFGNKGIYRAELK